MPKAKKAQTRVAAGARKARTRAVEGAGNAARPEVQEAGPGVRGTEELFGEIGRILVLIEDAHAQLHDPQVGLPQRMRLNLLRTELDAYLRGLRFAVGEIDASATPAMPEEVRKGWLGKKVS